ncbi:aldehyde dehydrogenase family protein [Vagococcus sp.]|uniref:aldehyde dehydrogenase family protein n=1 Tax=Vagococcus sp. TaxID=1933889 RepID=UPI003F9CB55F
MKQIDIENLIREIVKSQNISQVENKKSEIKEKAGLGIFATVDAAISAAGIAQERLFNTSLARRKTIIHHLVEKLLPMVEEMSERAVEETGMGNVEDKIKKNELAITNTPGVEDLTQAAQVLTGDNGMTLYEYCPYGVIGAITPSTNPTETLICNTIGMIAAGNAVYFSVHPGARKTSIWLIEKMNFIIKEASGIENLVVTIEHPSIDAAKEMMVHPGVALLVVTGGPGVVHQAMTSGKKVIGAGAGNPPAIVDETAKIEQAAKDIVSGASFDHNIPCIAEKNIVVVDEVAEFLLFNLQKNGAIYVSELEEIQRLEAVVLNDKKKPNKAFIGKSAETILQAAHISYTGKPKLVVVEADPGMPFAIEEMLMPVVPFIRVPDFECALDVAIGIEAGLHHTATIHSQNVSRLNKAARELQTSIFVKNGPSYEGIGFGMEGPTTFTIATPTGEGTTTARHFARTRRCVLTDAFTIK